MKRTTIVLPEDLSRRIRRAAAERGVSMSELIRQSVEEALREAPPKPKSIGIGASEPSDTGRRAGEMKFEPRTWR